MFNLFCLEINRRPRHWQEARTIFVLSMQKANPYLEESDLEVLETGTDSCSYKFWNQRIMIPALQAIKDLDEIYESEENREIIQKSFKPLQADKKGAGEHTHFLHISFSWRLIFDTIF